MSLEFQYRDSGTNEFVVMEIVVDQDVAVGADGRPIVTFGSPFGKAIDIATTKFTTEHPDVKFIRWQYGLDDTTYVGVYADTVVDVILPSGTTKLILYADTAECALNVRLHENTPSDRAVEDVNIIAPKDFLVYMKSGMTEYEFHSNNAYCLGYTLLGWSTSANGADGYLPVGEQWSIAKVSDEQTLDLYAIWVKTVYQVTVVAPEGGSVSVRVIHNSDNTQDEYTAGSKSNVVCDVYYDDVVEFSYNESSIYGFKHWTIVGEGELKYGSNVPNNSIRIIGNCAIFAQLEGLPEVTLDVTVNGIVRDTGGFEFILVRTVGTKEYVMPKTSVTGGKEISTLNVGVGTYNVLIKDGTLRYNVGDLEVYFSSVGSSIGKITKDVALFTLRYDLEDVEKNAVAENAALVNPIHYVVADDDFELRLKNDYVFSGKDAISPVDGMTFTILSSGDSVRVVVADPVPAGPSTQGFVIKATLSQYEYIIEYYDSDGNKIFKEILSKISPTAPMLVIDGVPYTGVATEVAQNGDTTQVWIVRSPAVTFVSTLSYDLFDNNGRTLCLYAVAPLVSEPIEVDKNIIYIETGDNNVVLDTDPFDEDVSFEFEGYDIAYDNSSNSVTFTVEDGGCIIERSPDVIGMITVRDIRHEIVIMFIPKLTLVDPIEVGIRIE